MSKSQKFQFSQNIFVFWFVSLPSFVWQVVSSESLRLLNYFSLGLLLKTFFDPWKRDLVSYDNLSLQQKLYVLAENLISRMIGMFIRIVTISAGIMISGIYFVGGLIILVFLFILPILIFATYSLYKKGYGI